MIFRLTRPAFDSTPGLVDVSAWPWAGHRPEFEDAASKAWRARVVALMIADGTLVEYNPEREASEWRDHFGILAEVLQ